MADKINIQDEFEQIYHTLQQELEKAAVLVKKHRKGDGLSDLDVKRLYGSLENAMEVYGETLGFITYDD